MNQFPDDFSIRKAMAFAQTPAGKEMIALLQSKLSVDPQAVANAVKSGDLSAVQEELRVVMNNPDVQRILQGDQT